MNLLFYYDQQSSLTAGKTYSRGIFRILLNIYDGAFCENNTDF